MEKREVLRRLYLPYDKVAEESLPPFLANNDAVALRGFQQEVVKQVPEILRGDYCLMCVATIDVVSCKVLPIIPYEVEAKLEDVEVLKGETGV